MRNPSPKTPFHPPGKMTEETMACQEFEMDFTSSVDAEGGVKAAPVRNKEKLEELVLKLSNLDASLHSKNSTLLTVPELRLCGLILGHVHFCILLYQRDKCATDLGSHRLGLLREASKIEGGKNCETHVDVDRHLRCENIFPDVYRSDMIKSWHQYETFFLRLKAYRSTISELYFPGRFCQAKSVKDSAESKETLLSGVGASMMPTEVESGEVAVASTQNTRRIIQERHLLGILQALEDMRHSRLYAPPAEEEIVYYQEIRKFITSFLAYMSAVYERHHLLRKAELGEEHAPSASLECDDWSYVMQLMPYQVGCAHAHHPFGHELALVLVELPEFLSILKACGNQLSEICSSFFETNGIKDLAMDDITMEGSEEKEVSGSCSRKSKMLAEPAADQVLLGDAATQMNKKTREEHAHDILCLFKKMKSSCLNAHLTNEEMRLYTLFEEHIEMSLWMFGTAREKHGKPAQSKFVKTDGNHQAQSKFVKTDGKPKKHLQQIKRKIVKAKSKHMVSKSCRRINARMSKLSLPALEKQRELEAGDQIDKGRDLLVTDKGEGETRSRVEYLKEIVQSIEAIKSSTLDTIPSAQEFMYYKEISTLICSERMGKLTKSAEIYFSSYDVAALKQLAKAVHDRELKWVRDLGEEYGRTVKAIFPWLPTGLDGISALQWVTDNNTDEFKNQVIRILGDRVNVLPEHQLELLDHAISILVKIRKIGGRLWYSLHVMHRVMNYHLHQDRCSMFLDEICSVSQFCEGFRLLPMTGPDRSS